MSATLQTSKTSGYISPLGNCIRGVRLENSRRTGHLKLCEAHDIDLGTQSRILLPLIVLKLCNRRPNSPNSNPTISDLRPRILNLIRLPGFRIARPPNHTRRTRISILGPWTIKPKHMTIIVVQDRYGENHAATERFAYSFHATKSREVICVVECGFLLAAEVLVYAIRRCNGRNLRDTVVDHSPVLNVFATDFGQGTSIRAIVGDELGYDGEAFGGIYCLVRAVEPGIAVAVAVEIAAVFVAKAVKTIGAFAASMAFDGARVRCHGCRDGVCFPYVYFGAAGAIFAGSCSLV